MQGFKFVLAAAAASTLAAAALPAAAQSYGFHWGWGPPPPPPPHYQPVWNPAPPPPPAFDRLHDREDRLGGWIGATARGGRIDEWQARRLFDDLRSIREEERSERDRQWGRLYPDQAARLDARLDGLSDRLKRAQGYAPPPPPRYGWGF